MNLEGRGERKEGKKQNKRKTKTKRNDEIKNNGIINIFKRKATKRCPGHYIYTMIEIFKAGPFTLLGFKYV